MKHPFAELIGLKIVLEDDNTSFCSLDVSDKLLNPHNVLHGGVIYSLADTGMGGALYPTLENGELCATVEINICYFSAVRNGTIDCMTKLSYRAKTWAYLESEITNNGKIVAKATGTYSIFRPKANSNV